MFSDRGKAVGGINWKIETDTHTPIYKIDNKDLLYSGGNSTQCSVVTYMGKKSREKKGIYVYI